MPRRRRRQNAASPVTSAAAFELFLRPDIDRASNSDLLREYRAKKDVLKEASRYLDELSRYRFINIIREVATDQECVTDYREFQEMYILLIIVWQQWPTILPFTTLRSKMYEDLVYGEANAMLLTLNHIADAAEMVHDYQGAALWFTEGQAILENVRCARHRGDSDIPDWEVLTFNDSAFYLGAFRNFGGLARVLRRLGNTAASASLLNQAAKLLTNIPDNLPDNEIRALAQEAGAKIEANLASFRAMRHPEPSLAANLEILDEGMQVYGSWKKANLQTSMGIIRRFGSAVFVYDGYLYVCGGQRQSDGPKKVDFWRLNIEERDHWEPLPMFHVSKDMDVTGCRFVLNGAKAYLFTGSLDLHVFDITTSDWSRLRATFDTDREMKKWPYPLSFRKYTMQCVDNRIYVFGGTGVPHSMGCDLFMELDIRSRRWRRLSGAHPSLEPTIEHPGPRISASSWVNPNQKKIYIMNGHADLVNDPNSPHVRNYAYDDLWSWDIGQKIWTKEKMFGNIPGPRSEVAVVYSSSLDVVIAFGGYSPLVSSPNVDIDAPVPVFNLFSYFADTFICDMKPVALKRNDTPASKVCPTISMNWRQVITRGFPTYRADAHLVEDTKTGRTYLFSGFYEREFLPLGVSDNMSIKSLADIWELRVNVPGGHFDEVDLEDEARNGKAGPWQRCFSCASVGDWKECAGSCGGRAFFCGTECHMDGWEEHKSVHNCRKI